MADTETEHRPPAAEGEHHEGDKPGEHDDGKGKVGADGKPKKGMHKPDRKELIIVVASVIGVIIAYLTLKKSSGGTDTSSGLSGYQQAAQGQMGQGNVAGSSGSDSGSGSSDANNGLMQLIEDQGDLLSQLEATLTQQGQAITKLGKTPTTTKPATTTKPHFIYGAAARGLHYIKSRTTGRIFQVNPNGSLYQLNARQYAELGKPKATLYGRAPKPKPKPKPPVHRKG